MADERWDTGIDYDDRPSGRFGFVRSAFRRVFGDGENFFAWGFPIYSAWGIRVRIHVTMVLFLAATILRTLPHGNIGIGYALPLLAMLFGLVLLHEYGHCIAARRVGGEADDIMLWPLGGLASCRVPENWRANLITTLGGPAVNAILFVPLGAAVWLVTRDWSAVIFNPFQPGVALGGLPHWSLATWLWSAYYINAVLLAFNMLLPMYPMDAGRVVHALLWRKTGHDRAMFTVTTIGLVTAGLLGFLAFATNEITLVLIGIFGGLTCFAERKRLKLLATGWDGDPYVPAGFERGSEKDPELDRIERDAAEQAEVDRILAKISTEGMGSLSRGERRTLKRASQRSREA
ncbi:MAG: hypothetical protein RIB60_08395 [Phycisphaerales bacterium]